MTAKRRELAREKEQVSIRRHLSLLGEYIDARIQYAQDPSIEDSVRIRNLEEEMEKNIKDVLDGKADYDG